MDKAKTLTTAVAFVAGAALGATTLNDIGAKDVDQSVNVQMVLPWEESQIVLGVVTRQGCPKIAEGHGAECYLDESLEEVRFDLFKDGDGKSMRMHARFKLPGKFKAK